MLHAFMMGLVLSVAKTDIDSDSDGLSDFHEVHKHFTDPTAADSDGDGVRDGDWNERREYTYTVRRVLQVLRPVTPDVMCDDYQDARITDETDEYLELEVIHYPLNTVADAVRADPTWRDVAATMKEWTQPGLTANWDDAMRAALLRRLNAAGIDAATLDDKALVEQASKWLLEHARYVDGFSTFCSQFVDGKAQVHPAMVDAARRGQSDANLTLEEQWQRELFARGMFEQGVRGSCTSSAIYLNGCLRALGIPTRIVLAVPLIDTSDSSEPPMVERLRHHTVRDTIIEATENSGNAWTSHTFNEVFVGGRWRRLNYDRLGQNTLDRQFLGLMTHVATFSDWADGEMASTWGVRQARDAKNDAFGGSNPYSTASLSDRFGAHAVIANPPAAGAITERVIDRLWWMDEHPAGIDMRLDDPQTAGHIVFHVEGKSDDSRRQYARFYAKVGKRFALQAQGHPDIPAHATRGYWIAPDQGLQHFYLRIEPEHFATMPVDVEYRLAVISPADEAPATYRWLASDTATIARRATAAAKVADKDAAVATAANELVIGPAYWTDQGDSPTGPIEGLGTALLVRMGASGDFDAHKRFTEVADLEFVLETREAGATGARSIPLRTAVGGVTTNKDSFLVLSPPDSFDRMRKGTEYTLRAQNKSSTHRWAMTDAIHVRRE